MGWVEISIAIGLASLFITLLIDMLARAFGLQAAGMWVKSEYAQIAVTFLIIIMAASIDTVGNRIVGQISGEVARNSGNVAVANAASNPQFWSSPTKIAKAYINTVVDCERLIYKVIYWINIFVEAFSKISFDIAHLEGVGAGFALTGWVTLFHYIMNNIVYLVLFHYIQYNVLQLSQYAMLPVFLPIGLALRAFPPTRGAGGFTVAFALGFAFIFPMTYVIIVAMMPGADLMCNKVAIDARPENMLFGNQDVCLNNAGGVMDNYYRVKNNEDRISNGIDYLENLVGLLYLQALFYPLASLIITLTFIRQTGNLFGADLAEIGRGLIKLI